MSSAHGTTTRTTQPSSPYTSFEVFVSKEDFKFHAAHFVAFEGYRERLHGHNYKVGVRVLGSRRVYGDGYVVDFGDIKKATRTVCKQLNEHFLCPTLSNVLTISEGNNNNSSSVRIVCQDGSEFVFPKQDCAMLPIVHATAEELAVYLWSRILEGLNASYLIQRGIHTMEVIVAEAIGQEAVFRLEIPTSGSSDEVPPLDVAQFVRTGTVVQPPQPCPSLPSEDNNQLLPTNWTQTTQQQMQEQSTTPTPSASVPCCESCQASFLIQLQRIADQLNRNNNNKPNNNSEVTVQELQSYANNGL